MSLLTMTMTTAVMKQKIAMKISCTMGDLEVEKVWLFLDQFYDQMDWYYVLNAHSN